MVRYSFFKSRPHREISPKAAPILTVSLSRYFINYYFWGGRGGGGRVWCLIDLFLSVFFSHPVLKGCCFSSLLFDILFKKSEALYNFLAASMI